VANLFHLRGGRRGEKREERKVGRRLAKDKRNEEERGQKLDGG